MSALISNLSKEKEQLIARLRAVDSLIHLLGVPTTVEVARTTQVRRIKRRERFRPSNADFAKRREFVVDHIKTEGHSDFKTIYRSVKKAGFKVSRPALRVMLPRISNIQYDAIRQVWLLRTSSVVHLNTQGTVKTTVPSQVNAYVDKLNDGDTFRVSTIVKAYNFHTKSQYTQVSSILRMLNKQNRVVKIARGTWKKFA